MKATDTIYTSLTDKVVGLSISESEDLEKLGFSSAHLDDAKIEIARHLLSCGAILMYGGDLRNNGYTRKLFTLVESYRPGNIDDERLSLINVLGWPIHITLTDEIRASLSQKVKFEEIGLPDDLSQSLSPRTYITPTSSKHNYVWSRSMTKMRNQMTKQNDARVILGGKTRGYKGKFPGIVEEAYLSIKAGKPTFLIGAYGGATQDVIEALLGKNPDRLSSTFQLADNEAKEMVKYYNANKPSSEEAIDFESIVNYFNQTGIEGLKNGLSEEDNRRLFRTIHIPEMISLILKGIVTLSGNVRK